MLQITLQDNYFTIKVCLNDTADCEDLEVVAAVTNTTLRSVAGDS